MFVNIIQFPPIEPSKDAEFREWFEWSNREFSKYKGFICRRLLKPRAGGSYVAIIEHECYETFWAMHTSPTQAQAALRVKPLFNGEPAPTFYDVVVCGGECEELYDRVFVDDKIIT